MRPSTLEEGGLPPAQDAAIIPFPTTPDRRLRVALRKLDEALAEQKAAIAAFRTQVGALKTAVAGLGESTLELRARLDEAAGDTARAQIEAQRLQATAAAMERLARQG